MRYFEDFSIPKDWSIGITNLLGNITTKPHSHKGGWTKLLKCQLENEGHENVKILEKDDKLSDFDCIIFDLGAEFSGGVNLFGGLNEKATDRFIEISQYEGDFLSWQHELPNVEKALAGRRTNKSTCEKFKNQEHEFLDWVQSKLNKTVTFDQVARKEHLLIGDSHTPSVWTPDMEIYRKDGRTLYGSLKNNLFEEFLDFEGIKEFTLYIGNIDVRHHLMRQDDPWKAIQDLCEGFESQIKEYLVDAKINVVGLLPIENPSRKIPKTGWYKGEPFKGEWRERMALVEIFNRLMKQKCFENGWQFVQFPDMIKNEIGELSFDAMERPQSVHLSPMSYRWDLDNNQQRW